MLIIPAIDLKEGKCVRLLQGRAEDVTVYSDNPAATAERWKDAGAELIHLVDLDGAFSGTQKNFEAIKSIRAAVDTKLELGGGIRDMETIDRLVELGIDRVILGTAATEDPEMVEGACAKYPGKILAGIDAKEGMVAIKGWVEVTDHKATEFAKAMEARGVAGIIYTDIKRDGMLSGPNIEETKNLADSVGIPVIASGGIRNIEDIKGLLEAGGIWGAITGKAIYSGSLDVVEAIELAASYTA
ncbi:MAG: 1-(5-phosphoribosyl)-5-[(5-phosphoribosylamino)methylideneamino]imidazole-4-carboxamide isomerase [Thermodesulfovibrionales bacterium]|nr:1-(5-phosphoribosyl)-5-[(5-phosphoribosylamino)methylideneamino]imidazole-4-carboxamide isomerase [Thermodesulfovibrionales bacterium]